MIGEDIPLMLFANWRGFSGGQKDMFEEVLKFGAYIVDSLRDFRQPVMVYLPPHATLRGGAWVVVDQTINEQCMEMYADDTARGGVLETEGTLDVKFRKKDVVALMHRTDDKISALNKELAAIDAANAAGAVSPAAASSSCPSPPPSRSKDAVLKELRARESLLFPTYHQVATQFADLHDTPGRMKSKGCIQASVPWATSREFFYWRLRRKMAEQKWVKRIVCVMEECAPAAKSAATALSVSTGAGVCIPQKPEYWREAASLLSSWVDASKTTDRAVAEWFATGGGDAKVETAFQSFKAARLLARMKELIGADAAASSSSSSDATVGGLASIIGSLSAEQKAQLKKIFA